MNKDVDVVSIFHYETKKQKKIENIHAFVLPLKKKYCTKTTVRNKMASFSFKDQECGFSIDYIIDDVECINDYDLEKFEKFAKKLFSMPKMDVEKLGFRFDLSTFHKINDNYGYDDTPTFSEIKILYHKRKFLEKFCETKKKHKYYW